eukprot:3225729-Pyramimonas_sp.AAC.1
MFRKLGFFGVEPQGEIEFLKLKKGPSSSLLSIPSSPSSPSSSVQVLLRKRTGDEARLMMANPIPLIFEAAKRGRFSALLKETFDRHPCSPASPWSLILYNDQAKP